VIRSRIAPVYASIESPWMLVRYAGWPAWLTLLASLVGVVLAAVACARRRSGFTAVAWLAALVPQGTGWMGYLWGLSLTESAVANVDPAMRESLVAQGTWESSCNLALSASVGVVPALLAVVATALTLRENQPR
jgi:hypothetical protein